VVMSACADLHPPKLLTMMNSVALPRLALMRPPRASPVYLKLISATTNNVKGAYTHNAMASVPYPSIPASGTIPMSATAKMACVMTFSDAPSAIPEQADVRQESGPCNAAPTRPGSRGAAHSATRTWRAQSGSLLCPAPSAVRSVSPRTYICASTHALRRGLDEQALRHAARERRWARQVVDGRRRRRRRGLRERLGRRRRRALRHGREVAGRGQHNGESASREGRGVGRSGRAAMTSARCLLALTWLLSKNKIYTRLHLCA
jgi:hypothetical protein